MTRPTSRQVNGPDLLRQAHAEGDLSRNSLDALELNADIGAQITAALGVLPDDVPASEVVLVSLLVDDSGSISSAGHEQLVRDGHNLILSALGKSRQTGSVLAHTLYLNGTVLYPYRSLAAAEQMTPANYQATGGTPLYDQTAVLLGTVLAKAREFETAGIPVRTVSVIITDGADMHSNRQTPASVKALVGDLRRLEQHIVAAVGIDDGSTDFRRVFRDMGLEDRWILTPKNSAQEIRAVFQLVSQSAVQLSQAAAPSLGGFGA